MVRLSEAKKDVPSCEKPGRAAPKRRPLDVRMGKPSTVNLYYPAREANVVN